VAMENADVSDSEPTGLSQSRRSFLMRVGTSAGAAVGVAGLFGLAGGAGLGALARADAKSRVASTIPVPVCPCGDYEGCASYNCVLPGVRYYVCTCYLSSGSPCGQYEAYVPDSSCGIKTDARPVALSNQG
jgi:hypothetical protein